MFKRPSQVGSDGDANLIAACILVGLDYENTVERSAIMEIDGCLSRNVANREAAVVAIRDQQPRIPADLAGTFFDNVAGALDAEIANGWSRQQTIGVLMALVGKREAKGSASGLMKLVRPCAEAV